jgi:hypothetical protein
VFWRSSWFTVGEDRVGRKHSSVRNSEKDGHQRGPLAPLLLTPPGVAHLLFLLASRSPPILSTVEAVSPPSPPTTLTSSMTSDGTSPLT